MNEPKHTPGPWYTGLEEHRERQTWTFEIFDRSGLEGKICETVEYLTRNDPTARANATLLAAAPELLAALKAIAAMAASRKRINMTDGTSLELFARAAIAKAEGRGL